MGVTIRFGPWIGRGQLTLLDDVSWVEIHGVDRLAMDLAGIRCGRLGLSAREGQLTRWDDVSWGWNSWLD